MAGVCNSPWTGCHLTAEAAVIKILDIVETGYQTSRSRRAAIWLGSRDCQHAWGLNHGEVPRI